jgi:hypothetical protein
MFPPVTQSWREFDICAPTVSRDSCRGLRAARRGYLRITSSLTRSSSVKCSNRFSEADSARLFRLAVSLRVRAGRLGSGRGDQGLPSAVRQSKTSRPERRLATTPASSRTRKWLPTEPTGRPQDAARCVAPSTSCCYPFRLQAGRPPAVLRDLRTPRVPARAGRLLSRTCACPRHG